MWCEAVEHRGSVTWSLTPASVDTKKKNHLMVACQLVN